MRNDILLQTFQNSCNILNTSLFNYSAGTFRPCLQKEQESSSDLAQQVPSRRKDTSHDIFDNNINRTQLPPSFSSKTSACEPPENKQG